MTKTEIISAVATQITAAVSDNSITPTILGGILTEMSNQLTGTYNKVTANSYQILDSDYLLSVSNAGSSWTVILPSPVGRDGRVFTIKRFDETSTGDITVDSPAGLVQDASGVFSATAVINKPWGFHDAKRTFMSNGTNWEYIY